MNIGSIKVDLCGSKVTQIMGVERAATIVHEVFQRNIPNKDAQPIEGDSHQKACIKALLRVCGESSLRQAGPAGLRAYVEKAYASCLTSVMAEQGVRRKKMPVFHTSNSRLEWVIYTQNAAANGRGGPSDQQRQ